MRRNGRRGAWALPRRSATAAVRLRPAAERLLGYSDCPDDIVAATPSRTT